MAKQLTPQEAALLIRARRILKSKGLAKDTDVKRICEAAGVSRKTGYQWAKNLKLTEQQDDPFSKKMTELEMQYEKLKERQQRLEFENEGLKLAWEIHGVDELLAAKKNTTPKRKKKKW